ncbi:myeloid-derived growth factor [Pelobates fuscus]|uniref:myeloid-derived growth factor n=1 Tax=Pelobates fuscus TaxID=191477 RepID=UPI002FE453F2
MAASWVFAAGFLLAGVYGHETANTEEFDVRPGGLEHSFSLSLGDYSCTFTYVAQGGTNEKWKMSVGVSEDNQLFSCSIWRPQGSSYLFFMQFKAIVTGGKIEFSEAYSQTSADGVRDVPLKKSEYDISETAVSNIPGAFSSTLSKLVLVARSTHDEL